MFQSTLHVDIGDNPRRPRPGRDWLANPYRVHQRIMWALDGATDQNRPLFRIYRDRVIVRTSTAPAWKEAFFTTGYAAPFILKDQALPTVNELTPTLVVGQSYWFDILFAPPHHSPPGAIIQGELTRNGKIKRMPGKRIPTVIRDEHNNVDEYATRDKQKQIFVRRLSGSGFEPADDSSIFLTDRFTVRASKGRKVETRNLMTASGKKKRTKNMLVHAAHLTGQIRVTNIDLALATLSQGIGPSKALGCGMLILGLPNS